MIGSRSSDNKDEWKVKALFLVNFRNFWQFGSSLIAAENFLFKSKALDSPLKATDFGLSDFIKPGKKFQDIVGSAYYVAPEVLRRKSGPESDAWSIGVITYILLSGRRPFWDKTEDGIFKEVLAFLYKQF